MKKLVSVLCLAAVFAFAMTFAIGDADANTEMSTSSMTPITLSGGELWPAAIAVDASNNLYVADAYNGKVFKIDASGATLASAVVDNPTAVALDAAGRVLVAKDYGTVLTILEADLTASASSFTDDGGNPGFYEVQDFAVDPATGDIYVADASSNRIKRFSSAYVYLDDVNFTFTKPYSVAVRNDAGRGMELCVGHRPFGFIISSYGNGNGDKAEMRCVNPTTGTTGWTYNAYGFQAAQISMPADLAVGPGDSLDNLLYMADPAQYALRAWNPSVGGSNTGYVRYVYDTNELMRGVTAAAVSSSGIIYVASLNTHDIKRFAIEGGFVVSPSAVTWDEEAPVVKNTPSPTAKTVSIENGWTSGITVSCTPNDSWVLVNNCPGTPIAGGATHNAGITVDASDPSLVGGWNYGSVTFTNEFGDSSTVDVAAFVIDCSDAVPVLSVQPGEMDFVFEEGRGAQSRLANLYLCSDSLPMPDVNAVSSNGALCDVTVDNVLHQLTVICDVDGYTPGILPPVTITITDAGNLPQPTAAPATLLLNVEVIEATPRYVAVTMGPGNTNNSEVRLLNTDTAWSQDFAFTAYDATNVLYGSRPAMGDVDSDGLQEIIVAKGSNSANNAEVKVFRPDGTPLTGANLVAFSTAMTNGARLAAGDLVGDGYDEVVVGSSVGGSLVRVFSYDDVARSLDDTGIILNPGFAAANSGVNLAVQDLDGDGNAEILAAPASKTAAPEVKAWSVDDTGGFGSWAAVPYSFGGAAIETALAGISQGGATIAAGMSKVAVGSGYNNNTDTFGLVEVYNRDGSLCSTIVHNDTNSRLVSGIEISVGDVDNDGYAEVLISGGGNSASDSQVSVYDVENGSGCITSPVGPTSTIGPVFGPALYGAKTAIGTWQ